MSTQDNAHPLEGLTFSPVDAPGLGAASQAQDAAQAEAAAAEAQAMAAVFAGVSKVVFAGLKALRAVIARKMPEILDEWPDEVLRAPADASAPVLQRYMERLASLAGRYPEFSLLVVSLVPMCMGYITALERHSKTVEDTTPKASE